MPLCGRLLLLGEVGCVEFLVDLLVELAVDGGYFGVGDAVAFALAIQDGVDVET